MRADGRMTVGAEGTHQRSLREQAGHRLLVRERSDGGERRLVPHARLDCKDALARRRNEVVEHPTRLAGAAEPHEPREREDDRVAITLRQLAKPRVDIPTERDDLEVLAQGPQLGGPAQAARSHAGALRERVE